MSTHVYVSFTFRKQLREILIHSFRQASFIITFFNCYIIVFRKRMPLPLECVQVLYIYLIVSDVMLGILDLLQPRKDRSWK